jgi:23S rRNA (uracil1939-C5)-methyltransferase
LYRPDAFAQANAEVNRALVGHAIEAMALTADDAVLELYAGNGNFSFPLSERSGSLVAVESSTVSIDLAQQAARRRRVANVRFIQGDCERIVKGLMRESRRFSKLFLDPPRTGAPGVGEWASRLLVERVVYVACDPAALARDAANLVKFGYRPLTVKLFDLFPQTKHIEVVMSFARQPAGSRGEG